MRTAVRGPTSLSSGRGSRASKGPISVGPCKMGGCCAFSPLALRPWRWLALAVDYRRLTCAALLLGGIGKPVPQAPIPLQHAKYLMYKGSMIAHWKGCSFAVTPRT